MDGDDTFEEFERVAMTGAAALSRAAEVLIRNAQDSKVRATAETARATEDLQRRAEAQNLAAERYYARAAEPGWVRTAGPDEVALAWRGAQQWAEIDAGRFGGYADELNDRIRAEYKFDPRETGPDLEERSEACRDRVKAGQDDRDAGADAGDAAGPRPASADLAYDTAERRAATSAELTAAGVPAQAREAKMVADHLNGTDPQALATAAPPRRGRAAARAKQARNREHDRGR